MTALYIILSIIAYLLVGYTLSIILLRFFEKLTSDDFPVFIVCVLLWPVMFSTMMGTILVDSLDISFNLPTGKVCKKIKERIINFSNRLAGKG